MFSQVFLATCCIASFYNVIFICLRAGHLTLCFPGAIAIICFDVCYLPAITYHYVRLVDLFSSRIQNTQRAIHSPVSVPMMLSTSGRALLNTIHSSGNAIGI